jgi:cell wall-associated NlpC family hydrolase
MKYPADARRGRSVVTPARTGSVLLLSWALMASSTLGAAGAPDNAEVPSATEIAQARENSAATSALVAEIEALIAEASTELQSAQVAALKAQSGYTDALAVLQERAAAAELAEARADQAAEEHAAARDELGRLAGDLYRSGGVNPGMSSLFQGGGPEESLYRASTLHGLGASRSRTFESAQAAARTWDALRDEAAAAREAADQAAGAAESAEDETLRATTAAAGLLKDKQAQRETLIRQLAVLRDATAAMEERRITALEAQRQEREFARALAAAPASGAGPDAQSPVAEGPRTAVRNGPVLTDPAPRTPSQRPPANPRPAPAPQPEDPAPAPQQPAPQQPAPQQPAPKTPAPAPPSNANAASVAVNYALSKTGEPYYYQWGGNGPRGYDCSGLVQQAYGAAGISLPRTATSQYTAATPVPLAQMAYGDLVFWGSPGSFYHVAVFIGNGKVVHALNPDQGILVSELAHMGGMAPDLHPYAGRL